MQIILFFHNWVYVFIFKYKVVTFFLQFYLPDKFLVYFISFDFFAGLGF